MHPPVVELRAVFRCWERRNFVIFITIDGLGKVTFGYPQSAHETADRLRVTAEKVTRSLMGSPTPKGVGCGTAEQSPQSPPQSRGDSGFPHPTPSVAGLPSAGAESEPYEDDLGSYNLIHRLQVVRAELRAAANLLGEMNAELVPSDVRNKLIRVEIEETYFERDEHGDRTRFLGWLDRTNFGTRESLRAAWLELSERHGKRRQERRWMKSVVDILTREAERLVREIEREARQKLKQRKVA